MKPCCQDDPQDDLFKTRLSGLCNPAHPLCRLAGYIDWQQLEQEISPYFSDLVHRAYPFD